jgi:hypothetical protein
LSITPALPEIGTRLVFNTYAAAVTPSHQHVSLNSSSPTLNENTKGSFREVMQNTFSATEKQGYAPI